MDVTVAPSWRTAHPGARVGVLVLGGVDNSAAYPALDERRRGVETALRDRFRGRTRAQLAELDTIRVYTAFYRRFDKSYHVLLQLDSIALKGKPLASATALVQAMFMAEVETQLLTAGHDVGAVAAPLTIAAATGEEVYTRIDGRAQQLKPGDMYMTDASGVLSSVIYGPDQRTRITAGTRRVMYVTYAPAGIADAALDAHLARLEEYVRIVAPRATVDARGVHGA